MNRKYSADEYYRSVDILREAFERPAITTDVIVGFPQESEEEFVITKEYLKKVQFFEMHIFKYSKRAGTRAAVMPNQVPDQIKTARSNELLTMEREQSVTFRRRYIGRAAEILVEEKKNIDGRVYWIGHTVDYVKVAVPAEDAGVALLESNELVNVKVEQFLNAEVLVGVRA
jgi:threonylcarbamoyladenosine tRNA methylthiotransferase MtaB